MFLGFLSFMGISFISNNILTGLDLIVFGVLGCIGPVGFYNHYKGKQKKEVQDFNKSQTSFLLTEVLVELNL